jgi:hypothetical protein
MKQPTFNPQNLRPVKELCEDRTIPFHPLTAARLCRMGVLPAVKVGNDWCTTVEAARSYFWKHANKAFKENHK